MSSVKSGKGQISVLLVLTLSLFLTSGCQQSPSVDSPTTTQPLPSPSFSVDPPNPRTIVGSGCRGFDLQIDVPDPIAPGPAPPGWEQDFPATAILLTGFECARVSVGPFERPATIFFEAHSRISPPQSCRQGDFESFWMIVQIWSDEPELAEYLSENLGIPTVVMEVTHTDSLTNGRGIVSWQWNELGAPTSEFQMTQNGDSTIGDLETERIFWQQPDGFGWMDIEQMDRWEQYPLLASFGQMREPTLYAKTGLTDFVGNGIIVQSTEFTATISTGDEQCEA